MQKHIDEVLLGVDSRNTLFRSALLEFAQSVVPYLMEQGGHSEDFALFRRVTIPERVVRFKVIWEDDRGQLQTNIGYRVQFNSALGPYKGGLRFDPSVNEDVLQFLGFEQIFKNALTGLPLGGGKGGSDFDPKGKSDKEILRFCTAFMTELRRHIGPNTDVPAGDIGVGSREIGYLYGAYKRLENTTHGVLTGKSVDIGGSFVRTEATGYGAVYFVNAMLERVHKTLSGLTAVISGSGNVATHVAEKLIAEGAIPLTLSDRSGYLYAPQGISRELIQQVKLHKHEHGALETLSLPAGVEYRAGRVWDAVVAPLCIPAATQHEIDESDAKKMIEQGVMLVAEAANMPCTLEAVQTFQTAGVLFGPAKAVNAGGVAVSGLEMSQNAGHIQWSSDEVDNKLRIIMQNIHNTCELYGLRAGVIDYVVGANIGGYVRVSRAMKSLGW